MDVIPENTASVFEDALSNAKPLESTPSPSSELTGGSTETPKDTAKIYSEAVSSSIATNSTLDNTTSTPIDAVTDVKVKSKS